MLGLQLAGLLLVSWQVWILSGPWVDGITSSTLFSRVVLDKSLLKDPQLGPQIKGLLPGCVDGYDSHQVPGRASVRSRDRSLGRQDWPWYIVKSG